MIVVGFENHHSNIHRDSLSLLLRANLRFLAVGPSRSLRQLRCTLRCQPQTLCSQGSVYDVATLRFLQFAIGVPDIEAGFRTGRLDYRPVFGSRFGELPNLPALLSGNLCPYEDARPPASDSRAWKRRVWQVEKDHAGVRAPSSSPFATRSKKDPHTEMPEV